MGVMVSGMSNINKYLRTYTIKTNKKNSKLKITERKESKVNDENDKIDTDANNYKEYVKTTSRGVEEIKHFVGT